MSELPENWITAPLNDVCHILDSLRIPVNSSERNQRISGKDQTELYPYYGATGQVGLIDDFLFDGEYVLLGEDGAPFLEAFKDKAYLVKGRFWVNNHAHILLSTISNKYLCYYLNHIDYSEYVAGTTRLKLTQADLKNISIKLAPEKEQKRIVAKIEELFSELDKGIENLTTAREQLKIYRQAILKQAFEGVQEIVTLEEVSEAVGGYAFKSPSFKTDGGRYQVIRMGNIRPGIVRADESPVFLDEVEVKILERYLLKIGDVLITLTGTRNKRDYGYTALVKSNNHLINQRIAYLRFNDTYLPEYFLYYSWTEDFKRQFFGYETGNVGQGNVGMQAIRATAIPKIDFETQKKVVQELDTSFTLIQTLEDTIDTEIKKSEALRQAILQKAFSGQLVAQDPKDEPASVLLERIRAEKEGHAKPQRKRRAA